MFFYDGKPIGAFNQASKYLESLGLEPYYGDSFLTYAVPTTSMN